MSVLSPSRVVPPLREASAQSPLLDVVTDVEQDVDAARFPLDLPGADDLRALRGRVRTQIGAHLLPRLRREAAPAIVVVGGSTGAGKSTLVNSTVGAEVSPAGVLRPTTRTPMLAVRPQDAAAFAEHPLAALADVVEHAGVPAGLALLDAPDLDSVSEDNRALAGLLLETADLWVFVTTAARYGDAVPWSALTRATARGVSVAVVLNRVPARVLREVRADLLSRLDGLGLGGAPLFVVDDVGPHEGTLPDTVVGPLREWLTLVGSRSTARGVVRRTTSGAWGALGEDLLRLADGVTAQTAAVAALRAATDRAATERADRLAASLAEGIAAEGAPTTRWRSLAGPGGPLAPLTGRGSRLRRGWRSAAVRARTAAMQDVAADVTTALATLLDDAAADAHAAVLAAWADGGAGPLVPARPAERSADARRDRVAHVVPGWEEATAAAVGRAGHVALARALEPDGVVALVQAAAAGVRGAEGAVQRLFDQSVEGLLDTVRRDLLDRARHAVQTEAETFLARLDELDLSPSAGADLRLRASELLRATEQRGHP